MNHEILFIMVVLTAQTFAIVTLVFGLRMTNRALSTTNDILTKTIDSLYKLTEKLKGWP